MYVFKFAIMFSLLFLLLLEMAQVE